MASLKLRKRGEKEYWYARVQRSGKTFEKCIGLKSSISKTEATLRLADFIRDVEAGAVETLKKRVTFEEIWEKALNSIAEVKCWKNSKTIVSWRLSFGVYAFRAFGNKAVSAITRDDVVALLKPIWATKTATASKVRVRMETFFDWAIANGYYSQPNPAVWKGNLDLFLPPKSKVHQEDHHEAPEMDELRKAVRYCLAHPSPASGLLLFVIATVSRVSEARLARPCEIENAVWELPAERRKDGKDEPHRVPLSKLASLALTMRASEGDYLFSADGRKPLALDTARLKLCMILDRKVTVHGIRSTFRDWAAVSGIDFVAAEKALMHSVGSAVTRAYLREDMLDARREIMEKWADALLIAEKHSL